MLALEELERHTAQHGESIGRATVSWKLQKYLPLFEISKKKYYLKFANRAWKRHS